MMHQTSQSDLARRLGIKPQSISKYLSGDNFPSIDVLILMAEVFDTTLDSLVRHDLSDPNFKLIAASDYKKVENVDKLIEVFEGFTKELKAITKQTEP